MTCEARGTIRSETARSSVVSFLRWIMSNMTWEFKWSQKSDSIYALSSSHAMLGNIVCAKWCQRRDSAIISLCCRSGSTNGVCMTLRCCSCPKVMFLHHLLCWSGSEWLRLHDAQMLKWSKVCVCMTISVEVVQTFVFVHPLFIWS